MVNYKLVYFNAPGRAEVSRTLFDLAGVKFEDKRVKGEEWAAMKNDSLFGQLPYLEVDGEVLCQSKSIERFLARKFGFAGKTEMEQAKVDMVMECMEECMKPLGGVFAEQDETKKAALVKKYQDEELPANLKKMEQLLKMNKGGDGFFVGDGLTVADLEVVQLATIPAIVGVNIKLENFPKLQAHKARVEALPKIAEHIANRPKSDF